MAAADNFFIKADQALKKRNFDYAIELYHQGLSIDPDRVEERMKLRAAQVRKVQESGGNTLGSTTVKIKNGVLLGRIKLLGKQKKFEEQIVEIEKFLNVAPQSAPTLLNLANAFLTTDRIESARQSFREVTEIDPNNIIAWKALGRIFEQEKDLHKAVECWERVKQSNPHDAEAGRAIRNLSAAAMMVKTEERKTAEGDDSFHVLLKDEDQSKKLHKKGQMIRTADDARHAIVFKKEEIEDDVENPRLWRELGDIHAKIKEYDLASEAYGKAKTLNPQDLYVADKLGSLQEMQVQDKVDQARHIAESAPDDAAAQSDLEASILDQRKFLVVEYDRRVAAHPTDFSLKSRLGGLYLEDERYDEAIAQFQNARKDPKFATNATYCIGKSFFAKGLFDLAIKEYGNAVKQISDTDSDLAKSVRYDLALAYDSKGDKDAALELLEEIMSYDINFKDVSQRVDKIRSAM